MGKLGTLIDSDRILGFTALGVGAGERITVVEIAMLAARRIPA